MQHGREAAANAAIVEPHSFFLRKGDEDSVSLFGCEAAEIEIVVAAENEDPMAQSQGV